MLLTRESEVAVRPHIDRADNNAANNHVENPTTAAAKKLNDSRPMAATDRDRATTTGSELPRKKMRQGTHSCTECRRRKIKCTPRADPTKSCQECFIRGLKCVDQRHGTERDQKGADAALEATPSPNAKQSPAELQRRVAELEGLLKDVIERLSPQNGGAGKDEAVSGLPLQTGYPYLSPTPTVTDHSVASEGALISDVEEATAVSLFNGNGFSSDDVPIPDSPLYNEEAGGRNSNLTSELRALLPSPQVLRKLLCGPLGRDMAERYCFKDYDDCIEPEVLCDYLYETNNPIAVAKGLLAAAICICHLPDRGEDVEMFGKVLPSQLCERYINAVEDKIMSKEQFAVTLDGVECGYIQAAYHVNAGRPRRAWLSIRRSLAHAQMLGLHRMAITEPKSPGEVEEKRRKLLAWIELCWKDVLMSLFLGLPHSTPDHFVHPQLLRAARWLKMDETKLYGIELTPVMMQVIARNQDPSLMTFANTLRIDQEQETLARTRRGDWWDYCKPELQDRPVSERLAHIFAYIVHHLVRFLLHMPFAQKACGDPRYQYSLLATLESSRELIRCYLTLKGHEETDWAACKVLDFWAFISAVLLVLNQVGHPGNNTPYQSQAQNDEDWKMVEAALAMLIRSSNEPGGFVSEQCAQTLKMLVDIRDGPIQNTIRVSIPFFGVITIGEGKNPAGCCNLSSGKDAQATAKQCRIEQEVPPDFTTHGSNSSLYSCSKSSSSTSSSSFSISLPSTTTSTSISTSTSSSSSSAKKRSRDPDSTTDQDAGFVTFDNRYGLPPQEPAPAPIFPLVSNFEPTLLPGEPYDWSYWTTMDLDSDWRWDSFA